MLVPGLAMSHFFRLAERWDNVYRVAMAVTGLAGVALGVIWVYRAGYGTWLLLCAVAG